MIKVYYKVEFTLLSSMCIGCSDSISTDNDVLLGGNGQPIIPATTIAGVYRSKLSEDKQKKYFGDINSEQTKDQNSSIRVYDGELAGNSAVSVRDCVALNQYKTSITGAKFDFEIVEKGAVFLAYFETSDTETAEVIEELLALNDIAFGSKTTRGYGRVATKYSKRVFDLDTQLEQWLDFDMFSVNAFNNCDLVSADTCDNNYNVIKLELRQCGGVAIRQYSATKDYDYSQLCFKDDTPVIPGTSWAGAFRHRFLQFSNEALCNDVFGFVEQKSSKKSKSNIEFSESTISNYEEKIITRNAIDRYSGGTKDGALYVEKTIYNGALSLEIRYSVKIENVAKQILVACIMDLNEGLLAVGGLTSVGRGIFKITTVYLNGRKVDLTNLFEEVKHD